VHKYTHTHTYTYIYTQKKMNYTEQDLDLVGGYIIDKNTCVDPYSMSCENLEIRELKILKQWNPKSLYVHLRLEYFKSLTSNQKSRILLLFSQLGDTIPLIEPSVFCTVPNVYQVQFCMPILQDSHQSIISNAKVFFYIVKNKSCSCNGKETKKTTLAENTSQQQCERHMMQDDAGKDSQVEKDILDFTMSHRIPCLQLYNVDKDHVKKDTRCLSYYCKQYTISIPRGIACKCNTKWHFNLEFCYEHDKKYQFHSHSFDLVETIIKK
jgi:hypothetical protein